MADRLSTPEHRFESQSTESHMRRMKTVLIGCCILILLVGCVAVVRMSGRSVSPDQKLKFIVVVQVRAGDERTVPKEVYVSISDLHQEPPRYFFRKKYEYLASSIRWEINWESDNFVTVDLYESAGDRSSSGGFEKGDSSKLERRRIDLIALRRTIDSVGFEEIRPASK